MDKMMTIRKKKEEEEGEQEEGGESEQQVYLYRRTKIHSKKEDSRTTQHQTLFHQYVCNGSQQLNTTAIYMTPQQLCV